MRYFLETVVLWVVLGATGKRRKLWTRVVGDWECFGGQQRTESLGTHSRRVSYPNITSIAAVSIFFGEGVGDVPW